MFNRTIYLDNNATTKVDNEVLETMLPYLSEGYGNPSSIYSFGKNIKKEIENSRQLIAKLIGSNSSEILFTSCATESNNTAIMSAVRNNPDKKHLITTKIEHSSILETMKYLEKAGYSVTYLSVDETGKIDIDELKNSITSDTLLISVMYANNEIGNIYPIEEIGKIAKDKNILFHVDAVQAIGKIKIDVKKLQISSLSLSGHKIHAPKGVGILYVNENVAFTPLIFGGHQESGKRGGTENVAYIVGLGKAAELIIDDAFKSNEKIKKLRDKIEKEITSNVDNVTIYGDKNSRLPNTTNMAFNGVRGEEIMLMLDAYNIFVSTGSACNSEDINPSHVLLACNANLDDSSPIRISLSKYTTEEEIEYFIKMLTNVVNTLRKRN